MDAVMQDNVLRQLVSNENSITTLLRALCILKPVRDVIVRLFTQNTFDADKVEFEEISTQLDIGRAKLDMCIQTDELQVVVEIKAANSTSLTVNQPQQYLQWLARQQARNKFFVFLVPSHYAGQYRQEYERRKQAFCATHPGHGIYFVEITWVELYAALAATGLSAACTYTRDFQNFLKEWCLPTPITFTLEELSETTMFHTTTAKTVDKMFAFVDQIASEFERAGFTVHKRYPGRRWSGEFAIQLQCGDKRGKDVLYLGVWMSYWQDYGHPLCIGVGPEWTPAVVERFKETFRDDYDICSGFLTRRIDQQLLELFPFKIRSGTKPLCIGQKGLNFAHNVSIFALKVPYISR